MKTQQEYFAVLAAAFVRGKLASDSIHQTPASLFSKQLDELSHDELQALIELGINHELRLHRFKRTMELPRVHIVYLDAPFEAIIQRNRQRRESVPEQVIEKLLMKLEVPALTEAQQVEWISHS